MQPTDDFIPESKRGHKILSRERARFDERVRNGQMEDKLILALAPDVVIQLVRVPAGEFVMGSKVGDPLAYDDEMPQHKVYLLDYFIAKTPVTIAQFNVFARATNFKMPIPVSEVEPKADHPITQISWHDACAFCNWLSKLKGMWIRLPSEAEWEKAARGPSTSSGEGRAYPWGNALPQPHHANIEARINTTTVVGAFSPHGDSPYGCVDMIGNVWEWTRSLFKLYPYKPDDGREESGDLGMRVVRGGSFFSKPNRARCASRLRQPPNNRFEKDIGFRICALIAPPNLNAL